MNRQQPRRILLTTHSLPAGGAEKFFVNLAVALAAHHDVHGFIPCLAFADRGMRSRLAGLPLTSAPHLNETAYWLFYKFRQLIRNRWPHIDIELRLNQSLIRRLHHKHRFHLINTHLYLASQYACTAFAKDTLPIVESDHGHYAFLPPSEHPHAQPIFNRLTALVHPCHANASFSQNLPWHPGLIRRVIPYGSLPPPATLTPTPPAPPIHIGMVARGVEEKGWLEALAACRLLRSQNLSHFTLTLIGEGPCLQQIRASLTPSEHSWITLLGHLDQPETQLARFHIGLLPTFLPGESLPNTIIEYLNAGLPIVTTPVGGIPEMLATPAGPAGILVPLAPSGRADIPALATALHSLISEPTRRAELASRSTLARQPFEMNRCLASYTALFDELLESPHAAS
jgi:glycosyltransferase involved in cell wall biosynthesis